MYSCSNGRCINNDVICRGLNPCGDFSDVCEDSGFQQTTAKVVLSTTKYIIIGVGAFVGLLCLAQGCFIVRRCCCTSKDDDEESQSIKLAKVMMQRKYFFRVSVANLKKVKLWQLSGNGAIRKKVPLQKPRWEKTKLTIIMYLY